MDLGDFDEAIFEMAYLIAGCAEVDGAVVLTKSFEVLGFGGEISGELPGVVAVRRALDLEGDEYEEEFTQSVGTRHRSAYRLALAVPDALAIVISQDGAVPLRQEPSRRGHLLGPEHRPPVSTFEDRRHLLPPSWNDGMAPPFCHPEPSATR